MMPTHSGSLSILSVITKNTKIRDELDAVMTNNCVLCCKNGKLNSCFNEVQSLGTINMISSISTQSDIAIY